MIDYLYYFASLIDVGLTVAILYAVAFTNRKGLSMNSQVLFCIAHLMRFANTLLSFGDLWQWMSLELSMHIALQIFYVLTSTYIVYVIYKKKKSNRTPTQEADPDFIHWYYLLIPSLLIGVLCNYSADRSTFFDMLSQWVDCLADLPQIYLIYSLSKKQRGQVDAFVGDYVFALSTVRMMFFLSYFIHGHIAYGLLNHISYQIGIAYLLRFAIYGDFAYKYILYRFYGQKEIFVDQFDSIL